MPCGCCAGKLLVWDWRGTSASQLWHRCTGEVATAWESLAQLFSPALRRTTVLLQLVWTADTFVYYGVVLLAATVGRPLSQCNAAAAHAQYSNISLRWGSCGYVLWFDDLLPPCTRAGACFW